MTEPTPENGLTTVDLAGPYALGALTEHDRAAFDAHLEVSRRSVDEVLSLLPVAQRLAWAVPLREAPPDLRGRTLEAVTGAAPSPAPGAAPGGPAPARPPRLPSVRPVDGGAGRGGGRGRGALVFLLVVALLAAGGAGWFAWQQMAWSRGLQENLDEANRRATMAELEAATARRASTAAGQQAAVLAAPDATTIVLGNQAAAPDARARVFWSAAEGVVLTASGLPPLEAGQSYHLWLVPGASPVSAGPLEADEGGRIAALVTLPDEVTEPVPMAVTVEPTGSVESPAGPVYLLGRPPA